MRHCGCDIIRSCWSLYASTTSNSFRNRRELLTRIRRNSPCFGLTHCIYFHILDIVSFVTTMRIEIFFMLTVRLIISTRLNRRRSHGKKKLLQLVCMLESRAFVQSEDGASDIQVSKQIFPQGIASEMRFRFVLPIFRN